MSPDDVLDLDTLEGETVAECELDVTDLSEAQIERVRVEFQRELTQRIQAYMDDAVMYGHDTALAWALGVPQ